MKKGIALVIKIAVTIALAFLSFYVAIPAINVRSTGFWIFIVWIGIIFAVVNFIVEAAISKNKFNPNTKIKFKAKTAEGKVATVLIILPVALLIVGNIASSTLFNAKSFAEIISVTEAVFEDDMPETEHVENIALMDTASAEKLANRKLGNLSSVVSQFQLSSQYNQINYNQSPEKVVNLEYSDFFKWSNNRSLGVPGYVMVDPVNSNASYVELEKPMKYVESACFGEDLHRRLRFNHPTKIFGSYAFEIDEEGNPYFVVSCMSPKVSLFGGMDVSEVIIFNPVDGTSEIYAVADTPNWVDNVYTGYLMSEKYDWHGTLSNGFFNSIFGQKDCKVTTDDFGYIILGDDVWYYTGVTSVVADESNIGFIISNARTGEYKYYSIQGAEEYSAMSAAEGEVQEKGYVASFPALINVSSKATYIMVLKDNEGLVKMYAFVNVENYSIVATGSTQQDARNEYLKLLVRNGVIVEDIPIQDETQTITITIDNIEFPGNSMAYIYDTEGNVYKKSVSQSDDSIMLVKTGDEIEITLSAEDNAKIKTIISWELSDDT